MVHAIAMLLVGIITYLQLGIEFGPSASSAEKLHAALIMAIFLPQVT